MRPALLAAAALAVLAGCQDPDVGQSCSFDPFEGANQSGDWFMTGNTTCPNLVCIRSVLPAGSSVKHNPYCSKACVSNRDCSTGDTGLVCRSVVLDEDFLAGLPPGIRDSYLGDLANASYCAAPLP